MKDELEYIDLGESKYEFTVYGGGFGMRFKHPLYDEYCDKIDSHLNIFDHDYSNEELQDILDTLKKSLDNGKDFYSNAKPYMKEEMEEYNRLLEEGVKF